MKNYVKKLISSLMAISLVAPVFSGIPVFAENSDGTIVDQTQALTVVGKRIKGDDTYFEISLEVNEDHDNFSSVGVVLRYDPDYIIPAESWDEGAGAADMSENTTWATRRALPTLGLETWSTHTALAYQEDTPAPGAAGGKKYGYLYLGAEHPLAVEEPEATADPSATAAPTADPSAPTAEPEATPAPGTRPVVVARFMYKTTAGDATAVPPVVEVTGANMKAKLTEDWTTGTNSSGSAEPINWDYDWTSNKILTIADDDVAGKSPAQYPFAIYTQDYVEKAYMHTWPTVTPTATTAPGDPTPTPMPVSAYAPVIGSGVDAANHLTKDDIMIITCEGESAKATGGLKLSDIFVILFFDWDDSLLGTLTAGVGEDPTEAVHNYVKSKFIHPELRDLDYASMTDAEKKERKNNYRGEYPETAPDASNPLAKTGAYGEGSAQPGSNYPLTNKLDYAFAGKNLLDTDHPYTFAYGWTQVLPNTPDYSDTTKYPGLLPQVLPKSMEDTITSEQEYTKKQTYGWCPELDSSGNLVNATDTIPTFLACDLSKITAEDLKASDGNLYLKAVYTACEWLGRNTSMGLSNSYNTVGPLNTKTLSVTAKSTIYGMSFIYERMNRYGYGVTRILDPAVQMDLQQVDASNTTPLQLLVENKDKIDVLLTPSNAVSKVGYILKDRYNLNVISGNERSDLNGLDSANEPIKLTGKDGMLYKDAKSALLNAAYEKYQQEVSTGVPYVNSYATIWSEPDITTVWNELKLVRTTKTSTGKITYIANNTQYQAAQRAMVELVRDTITRGYTLDSISWYQMQCYCIDITSKTKTATYRSTEDAKTWLDANHPLAVAEYENYN